MKSIGTIYQFSPLYFRMAGLKGHWGSKIKHELSMSHPGLTLHRETFQ